MTPITGLETGLCAALQMPALHLSQSLNAEETASPSIACRAGVQARNPPEMQLKAIPEVS